MVVRRVARARAVLPALADGYAEAPLALGGVDADDDANGMAAAEVDAGAGPDFMAPLVDAYASDGSEHGDEQWAEDWEFLDDAEDVPAALAAVAVAAVPPPPVAEYAGGHGGRGRGHSVIRVCQTFPRKGDVSDVCCGIRF